MSSLIEQLRIIKEAADKELNDLPNNKNERYSSYRTLAIQYDSILQKVNNEYRIDINPFSLNINKIPSYGDSFTWQRENIIKDISLYANLLIAQLDDCVYNSNSFDGLKHFIERNLRKAIHGEPESEIIIQDALENLFIGKGMNKPSDYDRETGRSKFSEKEYIPDFVISNINACIEVKFLTEGKKKTIIEQISADITAYKKKYSRILFVIYDMGQIQNEESFKEDIEKDGIMVSIIKH